VDISSRLPPAGKVTRSDRDLLEAKIIEIERRLQFSLVLADVNGHIKDIPTLGRQEVGITDPDSRLWKPIEQTILAIKDGVPHPQQVARNEADLLVQIQPPMLQYADYTVMWICALPVEAEAALYMLDARHYGAFPGMKGDDNQYTPGEIAGHKVVITCPAKGSTVSAAKLVSRMSHNFPNLEFCLLVGIGAGVPGPNLEPDIRLGDVIVAVPSGDSVSSTRVIGFNLVADTIEIPGDWQVPTNQHLRSALEISRPVGVLDFLSYVQIFASRSGGQKFLYPGIKNDKLYKGDHTDDLVPRRSRPSQDPVVHYGRIASGDTLIENARLRDALRDEHGIICFEMGTASLSSTIPIVVIRGACDYADSHKNGSWHHYASATAAAYAKGILNITSHPNLSDADSSRSVGKYLADDHAVQALSLGALEEVARIATTLAASKKRTLCGSLGAELFVLANHLKSVGLEQQGQVPPNIRKLLKDIEKICNVSIQNLRHLRLS
jgi:nucleoside phosphorylase